jgi:hypothetical protein
MAANVNARSAGRPSPLDYVCACFAGNLSHPATVQGDNPSTWISHFGGGGLVECSRAMRPGGAATVLAGWLQWIVICSLEPVGTQLSPPLVLLKTPRGVPIYRVPESVGSTTRLRTLAGSARPELISFQLVPPSVLLNAPRPSPEMLLPPWP